jgi:saccharopine dehydrogenase-like NADP-dependent oxidoreductase
MHRTIMLVGAGQMGRSALAFLARRLPSAKFKVIDRSAENLERAVGLDPTRIEGTRLDLATSSPNAHGVDCVINFAGPFFLGSDRVARAALKAGAPYVDVCDDVEGTQTILDLDAEAKRRGVPLITGGGLSPGVSNWVAAKMLANDASIDGIKIVWIVKEKDPGGLAVLRHMLHMAVAPCPTWRDGVMHHTKGFVPETAEAFSVPGPFNRVEAYDTAHPEPLTLSRAFPRLRLVECKGALSPSWANQAFSTLGRIGFGHKDLTVEIDGKEILPIEVLWKLLWKRHEMAPARERTSATQINLIGLRGDAPVLMHSITDNADMSRGTGLGMAAAALALIKGGAPDGAGGVEVLPADRGLELFFELARAEGGFTDGIVETRF